MSTRSLVMNATASKASTTTATSWSVLVGRGGQHVHLGVAGQLPEQETAGRGLLSQCGKTLVCAPFVGEGESYRIQTALSPLSQTWTSVWMSPTA